MYNLSMSERPASASRQETQRALREDSLLEEFLQDIGVTDWDKILKIDAEKLVDRLFGVDKK